MHPKFENIPVYQSRLEKGDKPQDPRKSSNYQLHGISNLPQRFFDPKPMIQQSFRSSIRINQSGAATLINTGLTDIEGAKKIAQNLFNYYDKDNAGYIDQVKVVGMQADAYKVFNSSVGPSKETVSAFFQVLDVDKDGKIKKKDLQDICIKYLTQAKIPIMYKSQIMRYQERLKLSGKKVDEKMDFSKPLSKSIYK